MKKVLSILFSALLVFGAGTSAFAASEVKTDDNNAKVQQIVDIADQQIQGKIDQAIEKAANVKERYDRDLEKSNKDEEVLTQKYNEDIRIIIEKLKSQTYDISSRAIDQAVKYDVKVERYYTIVTINDVDYEIDPIRVVGLSEDPASLQYIN